MNSLQIYVSLYFLLTHNFKEMTHDVYDSRQRRFKNDRHFLSEIYTMILNSLYPFNANT